MKRVSTIPVPRHMSVEDAWMEIVIFGKLVEYSPYDDRFVRPGWANVMVDAEANPLTEFEVLPAQH